VSSVKSAPGNSPSVSARNGGEIGRENREVSVISDMESAAFAASVAGGDEAARAEGMELPCGSHLEVPQPEKKRKRSRVGWRGGKVVLGRGAREFGPR
jgi:hypothetical protein